MSSNINKLNYLKYSDGNEWESIQDHYFVKKRIKDGTWNKGVNPEKHASIRKN